MTGYEKIKQMAKELRCRIPDLLVMAPQNDPFYSGSETRKTMAHWFANLWEEFSYTTNVHIRRVHYQIISTVLHKHDGRVYQNTDNDWGYLCTASAQARYLGLVPADAIVDHKNPRPHIYLFSGYEGTYDWHIEFPDWKMPTINTYLPGVDIDIYYTPYLEMPYPVFYGYEYHHSLQPFHLEVWYEKSTMNDVLVPLCEQYHVNLVTGEGFLSITSVIDLLKRVRRINKPVRIFYISDFDPAGDSMPFAISRQIEYWVDNGMDIKLKRLALTTEQVKHYRLPRVPIKESDRRKDSFEERYGEGAVELDALEALYPGELGRIVSEAIEPYLDKHLEHKLHKVNREAGEELDEAVQEVVADYTGDIEEVERKIERIVREYKKQLSGLANEVEEKLAPYRDKLRDISAKLEEDLSPFYRDLESLRQDIKNRVDNIKVEVHLPEPTTDADGDDWLFDSSRDYRAQLEVYKAHKNGRVNRGS